MSQPAACHLSEESAEALELAAVLSLVAEEAASDLGRSRIEALTPLSDAAELAARRELLAETRDLLTGGGSLIPAFEEPLAPLREALAKRHVELAGTDLLYLADVLRAVGGVVARVRERGEELPRLQRRVAEIELHQDLERKIRRCLDRRGEVRPGASPALVAARRRIRGQREALLGEMKALVDRYREVLSEETVPFRDGRFVLLLGAGARGRVRGLVHGRSATGKSFYFEPLEIVESNNRLQESMREEAAERRRVLADLLREVESRRAGLVEVFELLADLDGWQASCRFAELCAARSAELTSTPELLLRQARHPLLDPALAELRQRALGVAGHREPLVPLDLELGSDRRILVVTGPNAGGKTVALKTAGLLCLMAQCGLPVPAADGARIPLSRAVVATVGDEQDLLAERSTFSARLKRLREAWDRAGPESLILLDELGSGTDPDEGAALATALLEALVEKGCLAVVTTHLMQVAAAALELPGAACAAMGFDTASGEPLYRLLPGAPGASQALALAQRMGLPRAWLRRAESLMGGEQRQLRRLLGELERVRQDLGRELADARAEARRLEDARRQVEDERQRLESERRSVETRLRRELDGFRRSVQNRLREEVERLREAFAAGRRRGLEGASARRLFAAAPQLGERQDTDGARPLVEGGRVRHRALGWEGTLVRIAAGKATVTVRGKRLRAASGDLVALADEVDRDASPPPAVTGPDLPEVPAELVVVGRRIEPALAAIDAYLDRALLGSREVVRVVHGHGSGRLRAAVREHLKGHPAVAAARPAGAREGGDGATLVTLALADRRSG